MRASPIGTSTIRRDEFAGDGARALVLLGAYLGEYRVKGEVLEATRMLAEELLAASLR